ncbi:MAG TPA: ELM1/GtrOC1 family putative glycosyltransferase [Gammaproteobacteria bacterium]|nr:ELM1/GtrOC1 family putative glycosyltransferase [Gammaproteobacteria bacterium]
MPVLRRHVHAERLTGHPAPARGLHVGCKPAVPRVVWRFSDGKTGHDNQSLGLVDALQRHTLVQSFDIPVKPGSIRNLLLGRFPDGVLLPDPWLILGAGHATHLPMLVARRARGGKAAVLMRPDLPGTLFDLCVIPEHDRPRPAANILVTLGSLNRMQAVHTQAHDRGLLMVGGPSRHYRWDHQRVVEQIAGVIRFSPVRHWVLTTSRRTPPGFAEQVRQMIYNRNLRLTIANWRDTDDQWLTAQLRRCCCTWVTEDSVCMIYEALTAGLPVGLLAVPPRRNDRVVRGVRALAAARDVMTYSSWSAGHPLPRPRRVFDEANRIAQQICRRWGSE